MRLQIDATLDYNMAEPVETMLMIEAVPMHDQILIDDMLTIDGVGPLVPTTGEDGLGRRTMMIAEGHFVANYRGVFDVDRVAPDLHALARVSRLNLPAEALPYLWPSRYCEADRLETFVDREFGELDGGPRVAAMADWIHDHLDYVPGSSDEETSAARTFVQRQGVCRDFAHLLASFVRASGIPARLVSAYAWQLDPPDFHAVVEVWLADADGVGGWHLVDATKLAPIEGLVRIAVGRDATDIAFMTVFGGSMMNAQNVSVTRLD
ncbi:transglutaminase family protein [Sphingomonas sp. 1P06PA]|uniref:transglutaminase-like domain-containing protein n=1 Tax=Sphingomonas sp. 1P06PA TaxID=554121 RepID=UPI0039A77C4A